MFICRQISGIGANIKNAVFGSFATNNRLGLSGALSYGAGINARSASVPVGLKKSLNNKESRLSTGSQYKRSIFLLYF
jgi:hypothetical protein